jgi:hypothetical protein
MDSDRSPESVEGDGFTGIRGVLGVALLAGGVAICAWTFLRVLELLAGEEVPLVARLIPLSRTSRSILLDGQQVEMPPVLFEFGAYGMAVGLLSVAATMANALLRGGTALLQPALGRRLAQVRQDLLDAIRSRGA